MKCLIVDDEKIAIDSVVQTIRSFRPEFVQFTEIITAISIIQAKQILQEHKIDLVICDIEMPMGSGLDLLKWMRENDYDIDYILLTCYADFTYVKKAMKYGCIDYLLKPIVMDEFTEVMKKVLNRNKISKRLDAEQKQNILKKLISEFDYSAIAGCEKLQQNNKIYMNSQCEYYPILFHVKYRPVQYLDWSEGSLNFVFSNVIEETFEFCEEDIFSNISKDKYVLLLYKRELEINKVMEKLNQAILWFQDTFDWKAVSYVNQKSEMAYAIHIIREMIREDEDILQQSGCFQFHKEFTKNLSNYSLNAVIFLTLLEKGKYTEFTEKWNTYLTKMEKNEKISRKSIEPIIYSVLQMLYYILGKNKMFLSTIISDEVKKIDNNYFNSGKSIHAAIQYIDYLLKCIINKDMEEMDSSGLCYKLKNYIAMNLDKELDRSELSNYVHLNPDYLNRVFKKETGMSLTEYIITKKMNFAKELLRNTDMSVSVIAEKVGYKQYSYFATSFKKRVGIIPLDYRNKSIN